jgi:penicillin-binding protein 1C
VVWAEDRRFFSHHGVDYAALAKAAFVSLFSSRTRGASTITMQVAAFLDKNLQVRKGRRTLRQKWFQLKDARNLERGWRKDEILEAYLNLVYFSGEFQGIHAASRGLFGKEPHGLDDVESLILAALIRSPNAAPAEVIRRAANLNRAIGKNIPEQRIQEKIRAVFRNPRTVADQVDSAPHVARKLLKDRKESVVSCTLDADLQRFSQERLAHHLTQLKTSHVGEGAVLVVANATGEVLSYASLTTDPARSRFVDGVAAKRQAGSTLKPFLYAAAFDRRMLTPASLLDDGPLDISLDAGIYQPNNYDHIHRGQVTARIALASSLNIPAVRVAEMLGDENFVQILSNLGIDKLHESGSFYGPSLALGSADVTLWELVNAYRTLANGGIRTLLVLQRATDPSPVFPPVFSKQAVFLITDILSDREARSLTFGLENVLATRFRSAVKTGTSKDMRDNWCVGYSDRYTVGVWVGNFSGEPMWNVSGVTGAAPLWLEIMNRLHPDPIRESINPPAGVVRCRIRLPYQTGSESAEWFIRGTEPTDETIHIADPMPRIVYPPAGAVLAVDADIPNPHQRIFFTCSGCSKNLHWQLDGRFFRGADGKTAWRPSSGHHELGLCDAGGAVLDSIHFQVRGRNVSVSDDSGIDVSQDSVIQGGKFSR